MEIVVAVLIGIVSFFGGRGYLKKRKFYISYFREEPGRVISFTKYKRTVNNKKETRYSLKILASNGSVHEIDTPNSKAKKYTENSSVVILIPSDFDADKNNEYPVILKDDINYYLMTAIIAYSVFTISLASIIFVTYLHFR